MAKESDNSRYLRSTIGNIAFLAFIAFVVHEKAISETSLVTIMTIFLTGYFGVRAVQTHGENQIAQSYASNPRMQVVYPPVTPPREPPDEPPMAGGGGDVHTRPTRETERQSRPYEGKGQYGPGKPLRFLAWLPIALPALYILGFVVLHMLASTAIVVTNVGGVFK